MSTRLIVTADDVGLHPAMTAGAIRAHREGIVTACSIVAAGAAFDDAVDKLHDTPSLEVGVHLALAGELLIDRSARTLDAGGGRMHGGYLSFLPRYAAGRISLDDVRRELRAQIERVLSRDLVVTHLNGHQHLHLLPEVFRIVVDLAIAFGIGYVRVVDDAGGRASVIRRMSIGALSGLGRKALQAMPVAGPHTNTRTIGVAEAGHLTTDRLVALLGHGEGVTELVCHPGVDDEALSAVYDWCYEWEKETEALSDPRVRKAIEAAGLLLVAPSDIS